MESPGGRDTLCLRATSRTALGTARSQVNRTARTPGGHRASRAGLRIPRWPRAPGGAARPWEGCAARGTSPRTQQGGGNQRRSPGGGSQTGSVPVRRRQIGRAALQWSGPGGPGGFAPPAVPVPAPASPVRAPRRRPRSLLWPRSTERHGHIAAKPLRKVGERTPVPTPGGTAGRRRRRRRRLDAAVRGRRLPAPRRGAAVPAACCS